MFFSAKLFMSNSVPAGYYGAIQIGKVFHMSQRSARNILTGAVLSLLIVLSACSSQSAQKSDSGRVASRAPSPMDSPGIRAASIATAQVGVPYRYGGSSPSGFDCSGLVYFSYGQAGKSVPRTTSGLWLDAEPIDRGELRTGDVLFFRIEGKVSHVGMYLDDGHFVRAPASGRRVAVESLDSEFYRQAFIRGGRL
jgi:cell wall-associated NlpC family hydrolase